jgi:pimeloyl-ACP methyl ester carboxylesterase
MQKRLYVLVLGLVLVLVGGWVAWNTQTDGGRIDIKDVRFIGTNGTQMSGLLYIPPGVSAEDPAPAVLGVHGYINSRETQAGYAIELARRGFVFLALDQTGHGYSDGPAFANGFGGPDGLAYLRSLDIVDTDNIALEGHSMGGWAVVVAAAINPDGYRSVMLQGSATGVFGAPDGTPEFPRNLGVAFSTFEEFAPLMWGAATGVAAADSDKMKAAFGTTETVEVGRLYGSIEDGTARQLYAPVTNHPGDHLNSEAIGAAIDWVQRTLEGETEIDPANQVWQWNEIGRLVQLTGMVLAMLGFGGVLLNASFFGKVARQPSAPKSVTGIGRVVSIVLTIAIPTVTYFWLNNLAADIVPAATALFPQNITTGVMVWALGNALITLVLFLVWHFTSNRKHNPTLADYGLTLNIGAILRWVVFAVAVAGFGYVLLGLSDLVFMTDFRFWVVAVKLMESVHFRIFLGYLPFFTVFFVMLGVALHGQMRPAGQVGLAREFIGNVGLLVLGFIGLLVVQYVPLLTGGVLPLEEPLLTIVAYQFIPLLTIVAALMTYFYRKTGTVFAGAFTSAIFITWVIVAGQATHFAF